MSDDELVQQMGIIQLEDRRPCPRGAVSPLRIELSSILLDRALMMKILTAKIPKTRLRRCRVPPKEPLAKPSGFFPPKGTSEYDYRNDEHLFSSGRGGQSEDQTAD